MEAIFQFVDEVVEAQRDTYCVIADDIWDHPETRFEEFWSAQRLADALEAVEAQSAAVAVLLQPAFGGDRRGECRGAEQIVPTAVAVGSRCQGRRFRAVGLLAESRQSLPCSANLTPWRDSASRPTARNRRP